MNNSRVFDRSSIPAKAKIIDNFQKTMNIKCPSDVDFVVLTDGAVIEKEALVDSSSKIYIVVSKEDTKKNSFYSFYKNLKQSGLNIMEPYETDPGQVQSLKDSFEKKESEVKNSAATDSQEHLKLKNFYSNILANAFNNRVSDIHVEKRANDAMIKMRMNGELRKTHKDQPTRMIEDLCRIIYNIFAESEGKEVQFSAGAFQQAAINSTIGEEEVKLRYQSLPTYPDGFDVVLRLLPLGKDDEKIIPLTKLGFEASQDKQIKDIISKPVGALIIAGTTGSGKSTTLKNLLMSVNVARDYRCKIYTIEDPPEYKIPDVSQIPVTRGKHVQGNPFEAPLIATMRGDPDILMIGEIRDKLTADGLKKATQSGHQVMTTVHAPSGIGITERLSDFSISPNVMSSPEFITGLIYQKLLPVLCPHCSKSFDELVKLASTGEDVLELQSRIDDVFSNVISKGKVDIRIRNEEGCEHCKMTGISGRTICAEVIAPDFEMLNHFKLQDPSGALKYWLETSDDNILSNNMKGKSAQEHAILKMSKGLISPFDLEVSFGPINLTKMKRAQLAEQKKNIDSVLMQAFGIPMDIQNKINKEKRASNKNEEVSEKKQDSGSDLKSVFDQNNEWD